MRRPDDCSLTQSELLRVRREAQRALDVAGASGRFPTPVEEIMSAAEVKESDSEVLTPSFLDRLRKDVLNFGGAVKKAAQKVMGLFLSSERLIFIDQSLLQVKKQFIRLHETAHGFLPWQRPMYLMVEDSRDELDPDTADLFEREANVFASEVLFQLDTFSERLVEADFSIWTPVREAKIFGASNYSGIRQYVSKNHRDCAVVVLNPPQLSPNGFEASLRRCVQSSTFSDRFGEVRWPDTYGPDDQIGKMVPLGKRRASGVKLFWMRDRNGDAVECQAEAFSTGHNVFVLICTADSLRRSPLLKAS